MQTTKIRKMTTQNVNALRAVEETWPGTVLAIGGTWATFNGSPIEAHALIMDAKEPLPRSRRSLAAVDRKIMQAVTRGREDVYVITHGAPNPVITILHTPSKTGPGLGDWAVVTYVQGRAVEGKSYPGGRRADGMISAPQRARRLGYHLPINVKCTDERNCTEHGYTADDDH